MNKSSYELPEAIDAKESEYLYLDKSTIRGAGKGLFTSIPIYKNEIIAVFKGKIISNQEAARRAKLHLDGYFVSMLDGTIMDSKDVHCFAKYANDAEGLETKNSKNNSHITVDEDGNVCLVAIRNIRANEEIFCPYGKEYWKNFNRNNQ
jgi:SET domain-containing protein